MPDVLEQLRRYAGDVAGPPRHPYRSEDATPRTPVGPSWRGRLALGAALALFIGAVGYLLLPPRSEPTPPTATDPTTTVSPLPAVQQLDLTGLGTACVDSGLCVEAEGSHPTFEITTTVGGDVVHRFRTGQCTLTNASSSTTGTGQVTSRGAEISLMVPTDAPEILLDGVAMTQVLVRLPADTRIQLAYATLDAADDAALMAALDPIIEEFSRYESDVSLPRCTPTDPSR